MNKSELIILKQLKEIDELKENGNIIFNVGDKVVNCVERKNIDKILEEIE